MSSLFASESNQTIRIATFNVALSDGKQSGDVFQQLQSGNNIQAKKVARIIQHVRPDILLLNEIDGADDGKTLSLFQKEYLNKPGQDTSAITYPYRYQPDCNTGVAFPIESGNAPSHYGFGRYLGQYCMAVLSKYPLQLENIQSFQHFKWHMLPNANAPRIEGVDYYSDEVWKELRLSSKTHAVVPVDIEGRRIDLIIAHPTPPVFDGKEDRNGKRNHDEIRLITALIENNQLSWLRDDKGNPLSNNVGKSPFVVLGDLNASVAQGDAFSPATGRAIQQLLNHEKVMPGLDDSQQNTVSPTSLGGADNAGNNDLSQYHTAVWKMRADYVIPSKNGWTLTGAGVFWPDATDPLHHLVSTQDNQPSSSDHRLVWTDLKLHR